MYTPRVDYIKGSTVCNVVLSNNGIVPLYRNNYELPIVCTKGTTMSYSISAALYP